MEAWRAEESARRTSLVLQTSYRYRLGAKETFSSSCQLQGLKIVFDRKAVIPLEKAMVPLEKAMVPLGKAMVPLGKSHSSAFYRLHTLKGLHWSTFYGFTKYTKHASFFSGCEPFSRDIILSNGFMSSFILLIPLNGSITSTVLLGRRLTGRGAHLPGRSAGCSSTF